MQDSSEKDQEDCEHLDEVQRTKYYKSLRRIWYCEKMEMMNREERIAEETESEEEQTLTA